MSDELVMGIDAGTGSTKGVLATLDGQIVVQAVRKHGMSMPRPGWRRSTRRRPGGAISWRSPAS